MISDNFSAIIIILSTDSLLVPVGFSLQGSPYEGLHPVMDRLDCSARGFVDRIRQGLNPRSHGCPARQVANPDRGGYNSSSSAFLRRMIWRLKRTLNQKRKKSPLKAHSTNN
jgi:hypothetical protein